MDINQVGILLLGAVLGWFLIFAVRRNRVQWGAFSLFFVIVFGTGLLGFLYARDLLAFYAVGIFIGFFGNLAIRAIGTTVGGNLGSGLLEISSLGGAREKEEQRQGPSS